MSYITIEKNEEGKVSAKAEINGKEYQAEFLDMMLAVIWAEELLESEGDSSTALCSAQNDELGCGQEATSSTASGPPSPQREGFIPSTTVRWSPSPYNKGRLAGGMSLTARGRLWREGKQ